MTHRDENVHYKALNTSVFKNSSTLSTLGRKKCKAQRMNENESWKGLSIWAGKKWS